MKIKEPVLFECPELDAATLAHLCGSNNHHLKRIEETFKVSLRGQMGKWFILGEAAKEAVLVLNQLKQKVLKDSITQQDVEDILREFRSSAVAEETYDEKINAITLAAGRRNIQGKTPNQRKYLQSIADNTLTVGIGPAGCGKTYLAVAHAVVALQTHEVRRLFSQGLRLKLEKI